MTSWQLEIVGARLLGPAPISDVWLPFRPGVQAFYGRNGVGKTRLLDALDARQRGLGGGAGLPR